MARKRKTTKTSTIENGAERTRFDIEEQFNNSEDEFYNAKDKVLFEEGPIAKRRRRMLEQEKDLQASDEEVLAHGSSDDDDFDEAQLEVSADQESEDDTVWGANKADYYNNDMIETEADALEEEAEVRRLQQKQLNAMRNTDFGFDESEWTQSTPIPKSRPIVEKLPEAKIPSHASRSDKLTLLQKRYPEFELLAKDLIQLQSVQRDLYRRAFDADAGIVAKAKLRAVMTYLAAITMYFAVISTSSEPISANQITSLSPTLLREHAIIPTLVTTRQTWDIIKDIEEEAPSKTKLDPKVMDMKIERVNLVENVPDATAARSISDESEEPCGLDTDVFVRQPTKDRKHTTLHDLITRIDVPESIDESNFGDENQLTVEQAAEKMKRKKSLRFYTSQISQKANKRGAASRQAGGDDDVPHKERLRDKQERLLKEAERRGRQQPTQDEQLGDDHDDDNDMIKVNDDSYYESLVAKSRQKKLDKQSRAEAYSEAARHGARVYQEEQVGADGKRKITYAIEKNKGLTPKRKKDVRNPRVKKRKKFDEKVKKLGSIRQVYKGGEGKGGYGGEMTGIKTNLVKSVKL